MIAASLSAARIAGSQRSHVALLLAGPTVFIAVLAAIPAILLIQVSFAHRDVGGLWSPGFELTQYAQVLQPFFLEKLGASLVLAAFNAALTIAIALPAAYFISRMRRQAQVSWLVYLLTALSLSEVLIVFSFQVLLSTNGPLAGPLRGIGLLAAGVSLYPSFPAMLACLVYLVLPYVILLFYPAVSQLDDDIQNAAATMGASPLTTFFAVTIPMLRAPIAMAALIVLVFTLGSYLTPLVLGPPKDWTIAVQINSSAMDAANVPLAAAQAIAMVGAMATLLGIGWIALRAQAST